MQKGIYICFPNYEKVFDNVKHADLFKFPGDLHLDGKDLELIVNLYWNQIAAARVEDELIEW